MVELPRCSARHAAQLSHTADCDANDHVLCRPAAAAAAVAAAAAALARAGGFG
jgi:hypothetical protein